MLGAQPVAHLGAEGTGKAFQVLRDAANVVASMDAPVHRVRLLPIQLELI
jgi:hypothetical protein